MTGRHTVESLVVLQPVAVDTDSLDREGRLILANGMLVGILVRLDMPDHDQVGAWFLEVALGRLRGVKAPLFDTLDDATKWSRLQLKRASATA